MAQDDLTAGQGERIGGYRLGDVIGIGGTAEVRLAWPLATPTGAPLALKRLRPMHAGDPDAADCLRHEAQLMLDLSHPAIVRTLDAGEADGQPFLVMERLTGGSLQEVLRRHAPMHPSQVAAIMQRHAHAIKARLVISGATGSDRMVLRVETRHPSAALAQGLTESVRDITKLRAEIELSEPGQLPNDGKVIDDLRSYD